MSEGKSALSTQLQTTRVAQLAGTSIETPQRWVQRYREAIVRRLPPAQRARGEERYLGLLLGEMQRTPALAECLTTPKGERSVRIAIQQMAQLGLEPGPLGHCYLLPFKDRGVDTCTFILGYRGMIELAWRSQQIRSIQARVVFEGDVFDHAYGLDDILHHVPMASGPYKDRVLVRAYAIVKYIRGGHDFIVLDREEVNFYRAKSRASSESHSPWSQFEAAMWRKTAVRRLAPEMPLTAEAAAEFQRDEARELGLDLGETMPVLDDGPDAETT